MLQFYFRLKVYLSIAAISLVVLSSASNSQTNVGHMVTISLDSSLSLVQTAEQKNIFSKIRARRTTANLKIFKVNDINEMKGSTSLRFDNNEIIYSVSNKESKSLNGNNNIWQGKPNEKEANMTTLVFSEDDITGSVWLNGKLYKIESLGNGVHAFIKVDQSKALRCAPFFEDNNEGGSLNKSEAIESGTSAIDVLVAYTTAAKNASGNINSLIQLAIAEANQSYQNSNVNVRMNLVYTYEVNYTESGHTFTDKVRFKGTTDGYMDEVHNLRNQYGADVCILIISDADYAGEAYTIGASSSTAFCVVVYDQATGYYTFAHEIGHLQNCRHNLCSDGGGSYNHGYIYCSGNWRTIMSYDTCCTNSLTRLQYWSNPDITHNGVAMGTTQYEDNARMLDFYSPTVESFKTSFTSGTLASNQTWYCKSLSGNVTVPSGVTLTIGSGGIINLNGNSIISTGGTINYIPGLATINGLRATLYSSIVLKGLCGSIQTAANYAPSGQSQVLLENGNFNENVTFLNKSGLQITGNSTSYTQFGTLTLTNCDYFYGGVFGAKRININQTSIAFLSDVYGYGINKTDYGLYLYYSDNIQVDDFNAGLYDACVMASTAEADISQSLLGSSNNGIMVYNASDLYADHSYFCGTNVDLFAYNFSSILADYCSFDGSPNINQGGGSTITTRYNQNCGSLLVSNPNQQKDDGALKKENNASVSEFEKINSDYFAVNKKLANDYKAKTTFDNEEYCTAYEKVIQEFKQFIDANPDSPFSKIALVASARSYRRIGNLRGKIDAVDMKNFLTDVINNKVYSTLRPLAERLMVDYYRSTKNFDEAIKATDNLLEKYKNDGDYVCDLLYVKGLILAHDLKQPDQATESFSLIIQQYPENSLTELVKNELRILGVAPEEAANNNPALDKSKLGFSTESYPNPFNPTTMIMFTLPTDEKVVIKIYDILGREIAELVNEQKAAGKYSVQFDGRNLSSGVYFYRIDAGKFWQTNKLILTK